MEPRARAHSGLVTNRHRWPANGLVQNVLEWNGAPPEAGDRAPTAVLIHGFQDSAATWDDVGIALAEGAGLRVLAPDMRGFGDGPRAPAGGYYYFPDYVADVAGIVRDYVGPDAPLFVIGHSMGATVATYFAGAMPERVTKLALVDGLGPIDNPHDVAPLRMRTWLDSTDRARTATITRFVTLDAAAARLGRYNPDIDPAVLRRRAEQLVRRDEGGYSWKHDPLHVTTSPLTFFAETYTSFARRITCATLYVSGGPKGFHVPDEEARLASFTASKGLTRVTIDGGHALHWSRPAELGDALVRFWRT